MMQHRSAYLLPYREASGQRRILHNLVVLACMALSLLLQWSAKEDVVLTV